MFRLYRSPESLSSLDAICSSSLQALQLGHALWYPEPHATGELQIGNVGFFREGAFIRLFNLDTSAPEKRVTFWDLPFEITEPLPTSAFKIDHGHNALVAGHYCSHGVGRHQIHASADV